MKFEFKDSRDDKRARRLEMPVGIPMLFAFISVWAQQSVNHIRTDGTSGL